MSYTPRYRTDAQKDLHRNSKNAQYSLAGETDRNVLEGLIELWKGKIEIRRTAAVRFGYKKRHSFTRRGDIVR